MLIIGASSPFIAMFNNIYVLEIALGGVGFGVALADTPMMPLLTMIVDQRYNPTRSSGSSGTRPSGMYATVGALNDMAMNVAFIIGPLGGGVLRDVIGDLWTYMTLGVVALALAPLMLCLRSLYSPTYAEGEDLALASQPGSVASYQALGQEHVHLPVHSQ